MAFKLINGSYVEVDENGSPIPGGRSVKRQGATGKHDGLVHNNWAGMSAGTGEQFDRMMESYLSTGVVPTIDDLGVKRNQYNNLMKDFESVLKKNGIDQTQYSNEKQGQTNKSSGVDSMGDMFDFDTQGTTANKLFEVYKEANQDQYKSAMEESAYMEKDLNKMLGTERQSLIETMREDRKRMLKSGLSQSAIANREIQGLLQGQNIATELGTGFLGERRNLNQMGNSIDSMSKTQVIDSYNAGLGNMAGGLRAAQSGDLWQQALLYSKGPAGAKSEYDKRYNQNK